MYKNPFFLIFTILLSVFFAISYFLYNSVPTLSAFQPLTMNDAIAAAGAGAAPPEATALNSFPLSAEKKQTAPQIVKNALLPEPVLESGTALVLDGASGKILFSKNANQEAAIASITKLMTAMVFLENNPGWDTAYQITAADKVEGGKEYLFNGDIATVRDLFYLSLVGSANSATLSLVRSTGLSKQDFVATMNAKAQALNLGKTFFADPVGLSNFNRSTAFEAAMMAKAAFAEESIRNAVLSKAYSFSTAGGREVTVYSTDALLDSYPKDGIILAGGKTGYTEMAGYCFVGKFARANGEEIITAVLGGANENYRFSKTKELTDWTYASYNWIY